MIIMYNFSCMNDSQIRPSFKQLDAYHSFNGSIRVPGSKSITNRVLLISAIANGTTRLHNLLRSDDTRYMGEALKRLGVKVEKVEVGSVDFLRDMAMLRVSYQGEGSTTNDLPKLNKDQLKEF